MRICISNIAWDPADEEAAASLLRSRQVDAVDVAPSRYFPDPCATTPGEAVRVRDWWRARGLEILGMQALLFGKSGLNLFGSPGSTAAMLERLTGVCRVAGWMGAGRLVFGSPRNRDRGPLSATEAVARAVPWFADLGRRAVEAGVSICLEPNPPRYGCNFMTTTDEAARIVRLVDHPGIRLHLDAGAMAIGGEDPQALLDRHADIVGSAHVSEPDLEPVTCAGPVHAALAGAIRSALPALPACIEMRAAGLARLADAIERTQRVYGDDPARAPGG